LATFVQANVNFASITAKGDAKMATTILHRDAIVKDVRRKARRPTESLRAPKIGALTNPTIALAACISARY
jgi:hypothetical protein